MYSKGNEKHKQEIKENITWNKTWTLQNTKKESKSKILVWKLRCLNVWKMPPFIGQNSKLLIWWLIVEWVATS
jgi:hypothetical protein